MRIGRWGDSLAVRLPDELVRAQGLKEGDEVQVAVTPLRGPVPPLPKLTREEALETLRRLSREAPPGFKFDREEANRRRG